MEKKGTITQISSMFPPEEAQKASKRVHDAIDERQQQLNQLKGFIGDNVSLINLVHKLPDETHHNIMVPFGKAAFFPGRLIHTNELMVLLGEGYYAERTSKQTVEILKRRGKSLETQVESLKAIMQDLKAEAAFFDTTAEEAAEGLLEIREDYIAEDSSEKSAGYGIKTDSPLEMDNRKAADEDEDEEYKCLEMVMDKLEKEEKEAERAGESDGDEDEQIQNEAVSSTTQKPIDQEVRSSRVPKVGTSDVAAVSKGKITFTHSEREYGIKTYSTPLEVDNRKVVDEDEEYKRLELVMDKLEKEEEAEMANESDEDEDEQIQNEPVNSRSQNPVDQEVGSSWVPKVEASEVPAVSNVLNNSTMSKALELPQDKEKVAAPLSATHINMAFTGSIVERTHINIGMQLPEQQSGARSSRPVSRFKMQRKGN